MVTELRKGKLSNKGKGKPTVKVAWSHTGVISPSMKQLCLLLLRNNDKDGRNDGETHIKQ